MLTDLTQEQLALQRTVRAFAANEVAPRARELDREQRFPRESWDTAATMGLLGMCAPPEYGGAGLGLVDMCVVAEELSKVCMSTAATLLHQADLVIGRFVRHGTDEQKARFLPRLCNGSLIGCLAITEPEAGSDAMSMTTRAEKIDGGWKLSGRKTFITSAPVADIALVYARTGDRASKNIALFIVDASTPGYSRGKTFEKMGWRASPTGELAFDECVLGDESLLGTASGGRAILMAGLDSERIVMAAESVGLAQGALDVALEYSQQRRQFGQSISDFQLIREKLANMYTEIEAGRALTYRAARIADSGDTAGLTALASASKLFTSEVAMRATTHAVQVLGGYGYMADFPVERFMRDAKLMEIGEERQRSSAT